MTDALTPARGATVLVVEDEPALASTLSYNLRKNGYQVIAAADGLAALEEARRSRPDAIVLDLMLPKIDGLEVCRRIRAGSDVPILMLTARSEELDKVVGLELGADDYLTKPFGMRELMARLKALLRRSGRTSPFESEEPARITFGDIEVDPRGRTVTRAGAEAALKPREFDLLYFLAQHPGQVFTREQLLERVWGYEFFGGSRTVDVHVRWLREKLEASSARPRHLLTVRGIGYKLVK
ncbi:MAG: response regulator transcription factor [Chloroflexi bacterium]|nr:response regulator transcription factor [Chloroflexota bacterium]